MTQCEKILNHMKVYGSISTEEAAALGISKIGDKIGDLRRNGVQIRTELERAKTAGHVKRSSRYYLEDDKP